MMGGDDGDSPFGSPFGPGGPFGFGGERPPPRAVGLSRFGVRTDIEDLEPDGQLHEREGSRPGRATWLLHSTKVVKNGNRKTTCRIRLRKSQGKRSKPSDCRGTGRNVGSYTAIMDNLRVGDRIGALVESGRLTFYLNGKSLGAACSGL